MTDQKNTGDAPERITIAVDAMGGDLGPAAIVAGILGMRQRRRQRESQRTAGGFTGKLLSHHPQTSRRHRRDAERLGRCLQRRIDGNAQWEVRRMFGVVRSAVTWLCSMALNASSNWKPGGTAPNR